MACRNGHIMDSVYIGSYLVRLVQYSIFSRYDRQIWILLGGSLINSFGFSLANPFISLYLFLYRGIPMAEVGLALLLAALIGMVGQVVAGELCDRFGRKIVMNLGLALSTVGFGLLTMAILSNASYGEFLVFLCLREMASGFYRNIPTIMITDMVKAGDRNGAFSLLRICWNLGFALGPILGGVIATYSYGIMFGVATVTSGIYLFISLFLLRDTRPENCGVEKSAGTGQVWRDHPFLLYCAISALITLVYAQMITTFSTYSGSYGQINETLIGILFSLNGFMVVFLQYPIAVFLERFRLTTSLIAGTLLYAVGFSIVGLCQGFWQLFGCMFIISLGELVFSPPSMNIVSRMASSENRGRYMSLSGVIGNAGFAFGPAVGGYLMDRYSGNIEIMWLLLGGLAFVCVFGFLFLRARISTKIDASEGV